GGQRGPLPAHEAAHHHDLVAELLGGELDLLERLLGRVHGNDRGRDDAVSEAAELIRGEDVVGATDRTAQPRVLHAVIAETGRRIHDAEVDTEGFQALVHETGNHGGRAVEDVGGG